MKKIPYLEKWFSNKIQNKILGGLFEIAENEGEVGKTNGKIIAEQFHRLKFGDRFYFDHSLDSNSRGLGEFTNRNIKKLVLLFRIKVIRSLFESNLSFRRKLAAIFCDNLPHIKETKKHIVRLPENIFVHQKITTNCKKVLEAELARLNMNEIAKEIVASLGIWRLILSCH